MSVATVIGGVWSMTRIFSVVLAGGVGKNGSTVAVSLYKKTKTKSNRTKNRIQNKTRIQQTKIINTKNKKIIQEFYRRVWLFKNINVHYALCKIESQQFR